MIANGEVRQLTDQKRLRTKKNNITLHAAIEVAIHIQLKKGYALREFISREAQSHTFPAFVCELVEALQRVALQFSIRKRFTSSSKALVHSTTFFFQDM